MKGRSLLFTVGWVALLGSGLIALSMPMGQAAEKRKPSRLFNGKNFDG